MTNRRVWRFLAAWVALAAPGVVRASESPDRDRYMGVEELRPGMKGFGRTVLSGTQIVTFDVEVVSVMRNAFFAGQDVILVRCKGAGLEHTGIIGGMSGSPVYITDENGQNPRMVGAVAFGWTFNKDPICGVQPIYQMLAIEGVSSTRPATRPCASQRAASRAATARTSGIRPPLHGLLPWEQSRFAIPAAPGAGASLAAGTERIAEEASLRPLATPVMVAGASPRTLAYLRERLETSGFEPVPSGGFAAGAEAQNTRLEPGSVLCVPLMRGDMQMTALGTCTEVIGEKALGFGHAFFAEGPVELPMAAGAVHTVIPSVMRSTKLGSALNLVGTLLADEQSGIFGRVGPSPPMIPCPITVHGPQETAEYHYECVRHPFFTPMLFSSAVLDSLNAHVSLPREHTLRYAIEVAFQDLGTFRSANITSQEGESPIATDVLVPTSSLMENPLGKARPERVNVEIRVEPVARTASLERAELLRDRVKPGATLEVLAWWRPYRAAPETGTYTLKLPDDIPEGSYELTICSAQEHLRALRAERPYFFHVRSLPQMLEALNFLAQFQDDHVYLRLSLPTGGVSLGRDNLPDLPSYRQRILADSRRTDVVRYADALVAEHPERFVVSGARSFTVKVDKRADQ